MDEQTKKAIIFDFDGTIADSIPTLLRVVDELLRHRSPEDLDRLRGRSSRAALHELKIPLWRAYFIIVRARRRLSSYINDIPLVPGMDKAIRELARDHTLYVLSANSAANAQSFLRHYGIDDYFAQLYAGVAPWRKRQALRRLARACKLAPHNTWYVGDEDLDIKAAHRAGMKAAAVTWGFSNAEVLQQQQPEVLASSSDELVRCLTGAH
jgi:phosphoglycolate phosphatase